MKYETQQKFLKEVVRLLALEKRSISNTIHMNIALDETYDCSDDDLGLYMIRYDYPNHLISLGLEMGKIEQRLDPATKLKWYITDSI